MLQCIASQRPSWSQNSRDIKDFCPELRSQLNEQLRALDGRVDTQVVLVAELHDWIKRRADLHQDYAIKLDKLYKSLHAKHKEQKVKREQWNLFSLYNCYQALVSQTKKDARDHAAMADIYNYNIIPRFTQVQDDVQRIYKKCREIGYGCHEELLKVLHELHTTMRTYHTYQGEYKAAESKLRNFEAQRAKLEQTIPKEKLEKSKKFRVIEKEIQKRCSKCKDAKLKALKARNEYILSMDSANAAIQKYFVEDLSDIVDCMDFGFHNVIARALMCHISGQEAMKKSLNAGIEELQRGINNLDSRHDKQRFLEYNNTAFMLPKKFDFQGHKGDDMNQVVITKDIQADMEERYSRLISRFTGLKTESEEMWKTIETAEKTLLDMINTRDYDMGHYFSDEPRVEVKQPESMILKIKADRQETEAFYLEKFRAYTLGSNLISRLQARYELIRKALGEEHQSASSPTPARNLVNKPRRRRIGRTPIVGQPKLFGGSLEEYLEGTGEDIPLIVRSCIRVINLYGLHHQGIFRVSGSQLEINNFRESFERMEDPLADVTDASDINSVAGVLKLYLRELREPIFPTVYFDQFMEIAQLESKREFVAKVREVVTSLSRSVFIVMRYLFAFLNHLSEFSDENMMDPYNLAICFGPTLVPIPEDKDQVQYQNLVNELIKNIIIFAEDIFPSDSGPCYEKYISRDSIDLDADVGDAPADTQDDMDSEQGQSEDDSVFKDRDIPVEILDKSEILEAVAQFDFTARSQRELSFSRGDILVLHSQVSSDWWKGTFQGKLGLIPDKYILLKIRDEDKERLGDKSVLDDLVRRRASSSSESVLSSSSTQPSCDLSSGRIPQNGLTPHPSSPSSLRSQDSSAISCDVPNEGSSSPSSSQRSLLEGQIPLSPINDSQNHCSDSRCSLEDASFGQKLPEEELTEKPRISIVEQPYRIGPAASSNILSCIDDQPAMRHSSVTLGAVSPAQVIIRPFSGSSLGESLCTNSGFLSRSMLEMRGEVAKDMNCGPASWENKDVTLSQYSLSSSSSAEKLNYSSSHAFWEKKKRKTPNAGAPDLVMDLPVSTSSSSSPKDTGSTNTSPLLRKACDKGYDSSSSSGASSPGNQSPDMTAAECFAKQSQSTLKKTPVVLKPLNSDAQTQTFSPMKVPLCVDSTSGASPQMLTYKETPGEPSSMTSVVQNLDSVLQQLDSELHSDSSCETNVSVKAATDDKPSDASAVPSTPKLAARYLKAVAASGGSNVMLKPQVRVKPAFHKKPSVGSQEQDVTK